MTTTYSGDETTSLLEPLGASSSTDDPRLALQPTPQPSKRRSHSLLSWNLWCHHIVGGGRWRTRLLTFCRYVSTLPTRPLVICLQEIFISRLLSCVMFNSEFRFLERELAKLGYRAVAGQSSLPWLYGSNSGLVCFVLTHAEADYVHTVTAAETPAERRERATVETRWRKTSEWICNKGFLSLSVCFKLFESHDDPTISSSGVVLRIINCHLDSRGQQIKTSQVDQLATAAASSSSPVLVTGDFNICQQHKHDSGESYRYLSEAMHKVGLQDHFGGIERVSFPSENTCYDHMFITTKESSIEVLSSQIIDGTGISDHHGLLITFAFRLT